MYTHFCSEAYQTRPLNRILPNITKNNKCAVPDSNQNISTVPTFNSCTKCLGIPGIIHDRTLGVDAWMTSQLNEAFVCKPHGPLMYWLILLTCYPWVFVQPGTGRCPVDWCRN